MKTQRILLLLMLAAWICAGCFHSGEVREFDSYLESSALRAEYGAPEVQFTMGKILIGLADLDARGGRHAPDPELSGVDQVRIVVYKLNRNPAPALNAIRDISERLQSRDWVTVVSVNDREEQARILVKTGGDCISGMVIMAVDPGDEAVFINISGAIRPDQIGKITGHWRSNWVFKNGRGEKHENSG